MVQLCCCHDLEKVNSPELIESLATARSKGSPSFYISWKQSIATLPPMAEERLLKIVSALPSPASARQLALYLSREKSPRAALQALEEMVDESEEDLASWLTAFTTFADHIDGSLHRPTLREALGYLDCCQAVVSSGRRYEDFPQTVESLLDTYGYDGHIRQTSS